MIQKPLTAQRAKEEKMGTFIMTMVGLILVFVCFVVLLELSGFGGKLPSIKLISLLAGFSVGIFLFIFGMQGAHTGDPKTSIKAGSYGVVDYVEWVAKDGQPYYYMILREKSEVKLYSLPKDMVNVVYQLPETSGKPGTLEVIEKSGLRKATLYTPLRK